MSIAAGPGERAVRAPSAGFPAAEPVLGVDIGTSTETIHALRRVCAAHVTKGRP